MRDRLKELREIRAELQYYQIGEHNFYDYFLSNHGHANVLAYLKDKTIEPEEREIFQKSQVYFGKAHAIMSSTDNPKIEELSKILIDEKKSEGGYTDEKMKSIDKAIKILAKEYDNLFVSQYPPTA